MASPYLTEEVEGKIIVSTKDAFYTFHEPLGKDLNALDKKLKTLENPSDTESLSTLMEVLSEDSLTAEDYLNLPLKLFKYMGVQLMGHFRTDD